MRDDADSNRLADASSPYLLQHADNPVHWWPWCDQALRRARDLDRPILLSIGYSACHWCHVMAHESFEDPDTAELMNALFVNIKVDREERPDLDKIYQTAHQILAQRPGGWPLTVFLDPHDLVPFFAGTYFPPEPRHGLPAFKDLMRQIDRAWREQREAIGEQNRSLQAALERLESGAAGEAPPAERVEAGVAGLLQHFDRRHGGVGAAPKFPHPNSLELLLRHGWRQDRADARHMALFTLERMAEGGIFDQLGGGFCRYSVDDQWMIPHFEKMLYDNGPLLALYADAWLADGRRPLFRHVCQRTAEWVLREMQLPEGGYCASLDADSEGEEGRFYVWERSEVADLLDDDHYELFAARFGLDRPPNFEGRWHLHVFASTDELAERFGLPPREVRRRLKAARDRLFAARERRVRPGRDDKVLTSWNALMIQGMARAGRLLNQPEWIASAERALDYLRARHWRDGRLLAASRDGEAHLPAYLDDHAYLLNALLELLQCRWDTRDLAWARALAELLLERFEDRARGGFFFTADDHETLPARPRPFADDAMPSGNAIAAFALQRLGLLLGEPRYLAAAERTLRAAASELERGAWASPGLLMALQELHDPTETLVIRGTSDVLAEAQRTLADTYQPWRQAFAIPLDTELPPGLAEKTGQAGETRIYRCIGTRCEPPLHDLDPLRETPSSPQEEQNG